MRILLAEDERDLAEAVAEGLDLDGYSVEVASDGIRASELLAFEKYDLVLLDLNLPGKDGIDILQDLRSNDVETKVLILSARDAVESRVKGLDAGANDYLVKPFAAKELLARIRAMTRTAGELDANTLAVGNVRLNLSACALEGPEGRERLSNREFQILEMLMRHPGGRFPTERLLLDVWGDEAPEGPGVVWVYISCLRKKLAAVGADVRLSAARNQGYALEEGLGERA